MRYFLEMKLKKIGMDDEGSKFFSWLFFLFFAAFLVIRLGAGMKDANIETKCRVNSINDVLLSPMYALGCNLAKDRWDIKVN